MTGFQEVMTIDEMILKVLEEAGRPLSTYEIAKRAGISWGAANMYCYKLKDEGLIEKKVVLPAVGQTKKVLWWLKS